MSHSLYDSYDENHARWTRPQRVNGGKARAATAKRHPAFGIFLPDNMLTDDLFPSCYRHGEAGGQARASKAKRNQLGQFTKEN